MSLKTSREPITSTSFNYALTMTVYTVCHCMYIYNKPCLFKKFNYPMNYNFWQRFFLAICSVLVPAKCIIYSGPEHIGSVASVGGHSAHLPGRYLRSGYRPGQPGRVGPPRAVCHDRIIIITNTPTCWRGQLVQRVK